MTRQIDPRANRIAALERKSLRRYLVAMLRHRRAVLVLRRLEA